MVPLAVELALTGVAGSTLTAGLLTVAEAEPGMSIAPIIAGGGATAILATALVEVARRLLNGRLIPREVKDYEQEMSAAIVAAGQREDRVLKVAADATLGSTQIASDLKRETARIASDLADSHRRESEMTNQKVDALARLVEDLRDETRQHRRGI